LFKESGMPMAKRVVEKPVKTKPARVAQKTRYIGPDRARLTVSLKSVNGGGFLTFVEYKAHGAGAERKRGMFRAHETEMAARTEFERLCTSSVADGWREKGALPVSEFTELPKPGAALAFPKKKKT
jgi:hypothetical protein